MDCGLVKTPVMAAGTQRLPEFQCIGMLMNILTLKTLRLLLSGALLGVAAGNSLFSLSSPGEIMAGVVGAGGAFALMKATAII